jgi:hypothetical protein
VPARWEGDERGRGVGDARRLTPGAQELLAAMAEADWVAEHPDVHLSPHLRGWLEHNDVFELEGARIEPSGEYVLELRWQGRLGDQRGMRAAAFALLGEVAETATYVRQRRDGDSMLFEAATGLVGSDTHFDSHGHVIVLDVRGAV